VSTRFVNIDRTTPMLLPPDLREWVQPEDLVHFLVDALAVLDLSSAAVNPRGTGSAQYPPAMMLALLIYAYAQGLFSSRAIERATYQNVSVRYLAANTHPDHDTIATFRRQNAALVRSVFVQLLALARRAGLLQLGTIALDGTKLEANAAKRKTLTRGQLDEELRRLDGRVAQLLAHAEAADQNSRASEELPAELADAQARRARLLAAREELQRQAQGRFEQRENERTQRPPGDKPRRLPPEPREHDTINPTDPDSTLTPTARQRYVQGYNAQLAVSAAGVGLIVAADVVRDTNDTRQLEPMIDQVVNNLGQSPAHVLVDAGYEHTRQILSVEQRYGTQVLCPPVKTPVRPGGKPSGGRWRRECQSRRQEMRARLRTPEGRALYRWRGITVEPALGIIKSTLGFVRFSLRGLEKVRAEWLLVSLAFNSRRLAAHWS
jgi:transposase